jgi:selenide, water dikinase
MRSMTSKYLLHMSSSTVFIVMLLLLAICVCTAAAINLTARRAPATTKMAMAGAQTPALPMVQDLVLIGGGHSHVHVLKALGMKPIPGVQLTLITRDIETPYSGMLPGHIAGHFTREECHINLSRLARFANARLIHASATGLDKTAQLIYCNDGRPPVRYDACSIDVGSTPQFLPQHKAASAFSHVTPVKPIDSFSAHWDAIVQRMRATPAGTRFRIVVVGAGAGGIELALSMQHRLRNELQAAGRDLSEITVAVIARSGTIMAQHNTKVQTVFDRILRERGVELHVGSAACDIVESKSSSSSSDNGTSGGGGEVILESGTSVPYDEVIWCTGSGAAAWFAGTGLALTQDGFIKVTETLQVTA